MATWSNASVQKCKEVFDIVTSIKRAGANITLPKRLSAEATLDLGEVVYMDEALWKSLPRNVRGRNKAKLRERLELTLNACR